MIANHCTKISIFIILILTACAHQPLKKKLSDTQMNEMRENCTNKNPYACHRLAMQEFEDKNYLLSYQHYLESCNIGIPSDCSDAAVVLADHTPEANPERKRKALELAEIACESGSSRGCLDEAGFLCEVESSPDKAYLAIERGLQIGLKEFNRIKERDDLACVRKDARWDNFLKTKLVSQPGLRSTAYPYVYSKPLALSYVYIPGYTKIQESQGMVTYSNEAGMQIQYQGIKKSADSLIALIKTGMQSSNLPMHDFKMIAEEYGMINHLKTYTKISEFTASGLNYRLIEYVTGNEKYSIHASGTYLSAYENQEVSFLKAAVTEIVLVPYQIP